MPAQNPPTVFNSQNRFVKASLFLCNAPSYIIPQTTELVNTQFKLRVCSILVEFQLEKEQYLFFM